MRRKTMTTVAPKMPKSASHELGWSLGLRTRSTADVLDRVKDGFSPAAMERLDHGHIYPHTCQAPKGWPA